MLCLARFVDWPSASDGGEKLERLKEIDEIEEEEEEPASGAEPSGWEVKLKVGGVDEVEAEWGSGEGDREAGGEGGSVGERAREKRKLVSMSYKSDVRRERVTD